MEKVLPKGWLKLNFTDLLDIKGGNQPPKSQFINEPQEGYVRLLQIRDFGNKPVPTYVPIKQNQLECNENDVLIARYGASIGRIVTGMKGTYNVALAKVISPEILPKNFIKWYLKSDIFQRPITSTQRTAQNGFNKEDLESVIFPLPPLVEQERIVAKLDKLFAQHEKIKVALDRIPQMLKNFRQQILTQAVTGKLTVEWREGKELEEWKNLNLIDVILEKPRNGYSPRAVEYATQLKSLSLSATTSGKFDPSFVKYIDEEKPPLSSHLWLKNGDILLQRSNSLDYVGTAAIYDGVDFDFIYPDIMMKVRANKLIEIKYLYFILSSKTTKKYYRENATGTAGNMPKINQEIVSKTPVLLPPLQEQQEIVRRVESLFAKAGIIEASYQLLKAKVESLPQAILNKAFKGELVPQLSTDGDAKDLLAEIMALKNDTKKRK